MRIAFDIDEMLIPYGTEFPVELSVPLRPLKLLYPESLRVGSRELLRTLGRQGHDIWIYTTSSREAWYFKSWFALLGIRVGGVVNCNVHEKKVRARGDYYPACTKYPPAFGIDLLIDNCEGVEAEGRKHGYAVLRVDPSDAQWTETILHHLNGKSRR